MTEGQIIQRPKEKKTKWQTMVYKTLHRKLSITRRHYSFLEFYRIFGNDCFKKLLIFFIVCLLKMWKIDYVLSTQMLFLIPKPFCYISWFISWFSTWKWKIRCSSIPKIKAISALWFSCSQRHLYYFAFLSLVC
jgi:hypothetical protein